MKDTGIVRKVDVLGRVVVPKEIRKALRINEGDPLEIYTEKDGVVLKKYSPVKSLDKTAENVAKSLNKLTSRVAFVTDRDTVLSSRGDVKTETGAALTADFTKAVSEKTELLCKGDSAFPVTDDRSFENMFICPVVAGGDAIGAVVLADEYGASISETDMELARLAADFIASGI